ncbi:PTS sugar transporter subunit IIA [Oenococcus alcoholitolerans]|uniref:PTS sugar transporter subunit IIA n=1 Tax=Oenococcus alcoholitolerans TaxID=931074 RepID=UPI003F6F8E54
MMNLDKNMILVNQQAANQEEAIKLAGKLLVDGGIAQPEYVNSMIERNTDVSTYMGNFIAIPHGTEDGKKFIKKTGISVVQFPDGVNFSDQNGEEQLVTVVFGIAGINGEHLNLLSQIALFCSDVENVVRLADAQKPEDIINLLQEVHES